MALGPTVDVAIVGGGFTGLSTAPHLREAESLDVAVLESEVVAFKGEAGMKKPLLSFAPLEKV